MKRIVIRAMLGWLHSEFQVSLDHRFQEKGCGGRDGQEGLANNSTCCQSLGTQVQFLVVEGENQLLQLVVSSSTLHACACACMCVSV